MMPYNLIEEIGRGGMGCVYRGQDKVTGDIVAIKMMRNNVTCYPTFRKIFRREVEALSCMNNPSVVKLAGSPYKDSKGNFYLPMEFIHGETIAQYVRKKGKLSEEEAISIMLKILDAMDYVHKHEWIDKNGNPVKDSHGHVRIGCIHRDIKPSNIMIRPNGSICIIDFGIAKDAAIGATGETIGQIMGTNGYMSPEQANGLNIDLRTDIYSLGCVFYFMLTGEHAIPTSQNKEKTLQAIINDKVPIPSHTVPGISSKTDAVFLKAVDKNMSRRYKSVADFGKALSSESQLTSSIPTITIGRDKESDIRIESHYRVVSRNHLIIRGLNRSIEIEDISTKGTGINGHHLHKGTEHIEFKSVDLLPEVSLAGVFELNWGEVIEKLKTKGWNVDKPQPIDEGSLGVGWAIICFLIPLIGWMLWGAWKEDHQKKASQAANWAWTGFAINIIELFVISRL